MRGADQVARGSRLATVAGVAMALCLGGCDASGPFKVISPDGQLLVAKTALFNQESEVTYEGLYKLRVVAGDEENCPPQQVELVAMGADGTVTLDVCGVERYYREIQGEWMRVEAVLLLPEGTTELPEQPANPEQPAPESPAPESPAPESPAPEN